MQGVVTMSLNFFRKFSVRRENFPICIFYQLKNASLKNYSLRAHIQFRRWRIDLNQLRGLFPVESRNRPFWIWFLELHIFFLVGKMPEFWTANLLNKKIKNRSEGIIKSYFQEGCHTACRCFYFYLGRQRGRIRWQDTRLFSKCKNPVHFSNRPLGKTEK